MIRFVFSEKSDGRLKKVNAKFSKGVDFWKFGVLTEAGVEEKKWQKNARNLHRRTIGVQKLTFLILVGVANRLSKGSKKGDFWARTTLQDELFLVVILNTCLGASPQVYPLQWLWKNGCEWSFQRNWQSRPSNRWCGDSVGEGIVLNGR